MLSQLDFSEAPCQRPFKVVLDSRDNICSLFIIAFLKLLGNHLDGFLNVGLFCVNQNTEIVGVLSDKGVTYVWG